MTSTPDTPSQHAQADVASLPPGVVATIDSYRSRKLEPAVAERLMTDVRATVKATAPTSTPRAWSRLSVLMSFLRWADARHPGATFTDLVTADEVASWLASLDGHTPPGSVATYQSEMRHVLRALNTPPPAAPATD